MPQFMQLDQGDMPVIIDMEKIILIQAVENGQTQVTLHGGQGSWHVIVTNPIEEIAECLMGKRQQKP